MDLKLKVGRMAAAMVILNLVKKILCCHVSIVTFYCLVGIKNLFKNKILIRHLKKQLIILKIY